VKKECPYFTTVVIIAEDFTSISQDSDSISDSSTMTGISPKSIIDNGDKQIGYSMKK
jgi:hypothetical protein